VSQLKLRSSLPTTRNPLFLLEKFRPRKSSFSAIFETGLTWKQCEAHLAWWTGQARRVGGYEGCDQVLFFRKISSFFVIPRVVFFATSWSTVALWGGGLTGVRGIFSNVSWDGCFSFWAECCLWLQFLRWTRCNILESGVGCSVPPSLLELNKDWFSARNISVVWMLYTSLSWDPDWIGFDLVFYVLQDNIGDVYAE